MLEGLIEKYKITSRFGERVHPVTGAKSFHNGIDIATPIGTDLIADKDYDFISSWEDNIGGLQLKIADDNFIYGFAHLSFVNPEIKTSKRIPKGMVFARTGNSGRTTGAHLHLTMRKRDTNKLVNPLLFIKMLLIFIFISFSCTASRHIDKAVMKESPKYVIDYTISKYGDSYLPVLKDTLIDTIYVVGTHIDTFKVTNKIDTIILSKDNVITKVFRHYDTIWVATDVRTDTIVRVVYKDRYVVSNDEVNYKDKYRRLNFILDVVLILLVVVVIVTLIIKHR